MRPPLIDRQIQVNHYKKYRIKITPLPVSHLLYTGEESPAPAQKTSKKKKKKKSSQETPSVPQTTESMGRKKKKKQKDMISLGISGLSSEESDEESLTQLPGNENAIVDACSKHLLDDQSAGSSEMNNVVKNDAESCVNGDSGVGKSLSGDEEDKDEEEKLEPKQKLKGKKAKDARKRAREAISATETEAKVSKCQVCMTITFPV